MSTGKHRRLPYVHTIFPNQAGISSHHVAYGFNCDFVHDDYKLVRIVRFCSTLDSEVMVYSLKSNSWKKVCGFPYDLLHMRFVGSLGEGALHWIINNPLIVAFDLVTEEFQEVDMPTDALCEKSFRLLWWAFEGRLCVITTNHISKGAEMWVMKHNESSWDKLLSISDAQLTFPHCITPMAYLSNGNELVLLHDNGKPLSLDLKTNNVKNVRVHGMPPSFDVKMPYVESLVNPLPMVNAIVGNHKGHRGKKSATSR